MMSDENIACLPRTLGDVGGVSLWTSERELRRALGRPARVGEGTSEDDGGEYRVSYLDFGVMEVTINRRNETIERLYTADPSLQLLGRLHVGSTMEQVMAALGASAVGVDSIWDHNFCEESGDPSPSDGVRLRFDPQGVPAARTLLSIELTSYGP
jgi:hypothetical protein